jgi:adenylylsulfate kinase
MEALREPAGGGAVVWLTGLPASGKSTLAARLDARLRELRVAAVVLDGDEMREAIVPRPGHEPAERDAYYRTIAGLAVLLARRGLVVLVAATAHQRAWRDVARERAPRFVEVHVATPLDECRRRDPRGLYARSTWLPELPGVNVAYEAPEHPDVVARHGDDPGTVDAVLAALGIGELA